LFGGKGSVCVGGGGRVSVGRGRGRLCVWGGEGLVWGYKGVWVGGKDEDSFFYQFFQFIKKRRGFVL
jgi:hypothetical protein